MDYALLLIFKNINQEVICIADGESMNFQNGNDAIAELQNAHKHFTLINISAKNSAVVVTIKDSTKEIEEQNEEFIAEHKRRFGYEPNMFDGV